VIILGVAVLGWGADATGEQCGNGVVDARESCDDGDPSNNNACTNSCRIAMCGDGHIQSGNERCDDGNQIAGDGCDESCMPER
jgi:cysteine-rich repeat protein